VKRICADLVLLNGKVRSMDSRDRIFEAVATKNGKIVAATSRKRIAKFIGKRTRIIDLAGRTVSPGLIDTHSHLAVAGIYMTSTIDFREPEAVSIEDIVERIRKKVAESDNAKGIVGHHWDETRLKEKRYVTRWDLDPVSPENPVVLLHESGNAVVANSCALKLAGVDATTRDPEGLILKNENGEPTGFLRENASNLVLNKIPLTVQQIEAGIRLVQEHYVKEGITTNKDPDGLFGKAKYPPMIEAYRNLHAKGQLKIRSYLLCEVDTIEDVDRVYAEARARSDGMLKVGGIKLLIDGFMRESTAWMYEDFNVNYHQVNTGNKGHPVIDLDTFRKLVFRAHRRGLQVGIHAVGDRAIDTVLDVIEDSIRKKPRRDHRHSIIHCTIPTQQALRRIKKSGMVVEVQPSFVLYSLGDVFAGCLGPKRSKRILPMRSYVKMGITIGNGSDYDFVDPYPLAPRFGLYATCARRPKIELFGSKPFGTRERLSISEALRTYTSWAAKCLFWEDKIGSIEPGKYADLVVWSDDPYSVPCEKLKDLKVYMTIVGGTIVYEAENANER
jgi:predicted amidohydrolase YtcJ